MTTAQEILADHSIHIKSLTLGNQTTTCPWCSHTRTKKTDQCLSVKVDDEGVRWNCHHCGQHGGEFYDQQKRSTKSKLNFVTRGLPENQPSKSAANLSTINNNLRDNSDEPRLLARVKMTMEPSQFDKHNIVYDYENLDGEVIYRMERVDHRDGAKDFFPSIPDRNFSWRRCKSGEKPPAVFYHWPDIDAAPLDAVIFMAEGERKADKIRAWGYPATSSKFLPKELPSTVKGRTFGILQDNDQHGAKIADAAINRLSEAGAHCFKVPLEGLPVGGDIVDWNGSAQEFNETASTALREVTKPLVTATPYDWPIAANIVPRDWLFGYCVLRGEIAAIVAPTGTGKSSFTTGSAMSLISGNEFLGIKLWSGAKRVWLFNLEDDRKEMDRQIAAVKIHHEIGEGDCSDRLFVDSGLDQQLCTARDMKDGTTIHEPVFDALKQQILDRKIDILIIDPFISSHEVSENDNVKINAVAKRWKLLAYEANCAIILVHHSRKSNGGGETRAEDSRGASALISAARTALTLNQMNEKDAEGFGITDDMERRSIFRVTNDKSNRSPTGDNSWFKLHSVDIGNANGLMPSDLVGAAAPWSAPDPFEDVTVSHLRGVWGLVEKGEYRSSPQAENWVGYAVAEVLGLDVNRPADKAKIKALLKTWTAEGKFRIEKRPANGRKDRPFVVVGEPVLP